MVILYVVVAVAVLFLPLVMRLLPGPEQQPTSWVGGLKWLTPLLLGPAIAAGFWAIGRAEASSEVLASHDTGVTLAYATAWAAVAIRMLAWKFGRNGGGDEARIKAARRQGIAVVLLIIVPSGVLCFGLWIGSVAAVGRVLSCGISMASATCTYWILASRVASTASFGLAVDERLQDRVAHLARKAGVATPIAAVVGDGSPCMNAWLIGFVGKCKLIITSHCIEELGNEEFDAIIAHEVGHLRSRHNLLFLLAAGVVSGVCGSVGGLIGRDNVYVACFVGYSILCTGGLFAIGLLMRRCEFAADQFAVTLTQDRAALASAIRKMDANNTAVGYLARKKWRWFQTHPAAESRAKLLEQADAPLRGQ